ncbi:MULTISPECIES: thioredoxin family protein [unclassified Thioalkalivibrio]|uniref:thioredoxin family protein n=1 Tax=unclassified Thioalkalivibrio TaxID=2621013 RepID=UPI0003A596C0|nr:MULTISPECIES: thioredoxin family protein [unclassified Thioalkalivibrio]
MLRNPILMLALLAFLVPALATAAVEDPRDPTHHFFDPTFGEFPEELEEARAAGKKGILIFFEMADCPFCHRMKNQVLNQPEVQEYFSEHFRVFSVDVEGAIEIVTFEGETKTQMDWATRDYRVRATPVFQFFNLEGEPIARFTGATRDSREFLQLGEFVAEGHYKDQNFTRFKREQDGR